jgi:hypothetical protein
MSLAHRSTISDPICHSAAGLWTAQLIVDESDPVIFDHGVDHVPGMLILHGIAELVERASLGPAGECAAASFDLTFTRFVEKDRPANVVIAPAGPQLWHAELAQLNRTVVAGKVGTISLDALGYHKVSERTASPPLAAAALVHRRRPENIVVSPLRTMASGYVVDYAPSEAVRTKRFEDAHCPLDIVEAARQFMILLSHAVCGYDLDRRLILNRLIVTMPKLFPRTAAVHLRSAQPQVNRSQLDMTIYAYCGDAPAATIVWDIKAVTPTVYTRLRSMT